MGSETMSYWVEIMDDLVPAGSSPLQWDGPMEALHKQISFMLLMSSILLALVIGNFSQISYLILIFLFIILTMQITVWSAFKRKSMNALVPAMFNLLLTVVLFSLISIYFLALGISLGDLFYILIGIVTLFTTMNAWRRLGVLRDPVYQAWYNGNKIDLTSMSLNSETVVSCVHCESILAIEISKFTMNLECPTCNKSLVLDETKLQLMEEE